MTYYDFKTILDTVDFHSNRLDLNSIHKKNLKLLLEYNYVEAVDEMDGSPNFYILTQKGSNLINESN